MKKICEGHWYATKRVLRYLMGAQAFGLKYSKVEDLKLVGNTYHNLMGIRRMECLLQDTL
jgi:hypothetical protein